GLHQAFMNSPHHRDNILDPVYNYVGIGVEHSSDGTMYVTEQFMAGPPDLGATQSAPPDTHIASVTGPPSLPKTYCYFAEDYTGANFDQYLTLANPQAAVARIVVTYLFSDGTTMDQPLDLPARSRSTVSVNQVVGPDREVALRVASSIPVMAERPM